jgi:hypothetical protein
MVTKNGRLNLGLAHYWLLTAVLAALLGTIGFVLTALTLAR